MDRSNWQFNIAEDQPNSETESWQFFNKLWLRFSSAQSSYYFVFLRILMENLYHADFDLGITSYLLFASFTNIYWNLIVRDEIRQSDFKHKYSSLEGLFNRLQKSLQIPRQTSFQDLNSETQKKIIFQIKKAAKRYLGEINSITGQHIFEYDIRREYIRLDKTVYRFLQARLPALYRVNNFEFMIFLQKNNDVQTADRIINGMRNDPEPKKIQLFRDILQEYDTNPKECFYCCKKMVNIHVDHFVPREFVLNDYLWNVVFCCSDCMKRKGGKVAPSQYLEKIIIRNQHMQLLDIHTLENRIRFYKESKMRELYQSCISSGTCDDYGLKEQSQS